MGGMHPTILQKEVKQHADAVVIGEADNLWVQVLDDCENGRLKEFYQEEEFPDLSKLVIPKWDNINLKNYPKRNRRKTTNDADLHDPRLSLWLQFFVVCLHSSGNQPGSSPSVTCFKNSTPRKRPNISSPTTMFVATRITVGSCFPHLKEETSTGCLR